MRPIIQEIEAVGSPESWVDRLRGFPGVILLRSGMFESPQTRYTFLTARPFLTFRSHASRCELSWSAGKHVQFGNPWQLLRSLLARYEMFDEADCPFPLGGCFGFFGYDLKNFVEPSLSRRAIPDLDLPDCQVGFYDSLVAHDHRLGKTWVISTGLLPDGTRQESRAARELEFWVRLLESRVEQEFCFSGQPLQDPTEICSNFSRQDFMERVRKAQAYIRQGDIYQVNLSQRLEAPLNCHAWTLYQRLFEVSPAPHSAFFDAGEFQIASSSPEMFLRLSGNHILTRPIKGTRPRSSDPIRDAQLMYELQTSPKEMAELVMITDLLRNDLGRVCEYGSVQVPELVRLERYPHVQHLVSTIEGQLRDCVTHLDAISACFPGGSITGAPKVRAMQIIDELEPVTRGPYTGGLGYVGFNRESQLSILIRTIVCANGQAYFHAGAGIVADSQPGAEYEETIAKARGFFAALGQPLSLEPKVKICI